MDGTNYDRKYQKIAQKAFVPFKMNWITNIYLANMGVF